ncbi:MAG: pantoate--beta-alanine ligase [Gammaproteobacteria bacterium]|nr:pantoate--beta-alanine ligase [Gammaproteobacteria bacterium]
MQRCETPAALRAALAGRGGRVALVPTMGSLHAGHLRLVERAREAADVVVASVFVNPLQFGRGEDYACYPRALEADAAQLGQAGADVLFAPSVETIYPHGYPPATTVQLAGELVDSLEGAHRPGHFTGVATVVNILFNLVQPAVAVLGEKDYQQLCVIRRMVADLGLAVEILGQPTVRAADGLALSSRNRYLGAVERAVAPRLYQALRALAERLTAGQRDFTALERQAVAGLRTAGFAPDYVAVRDPQLRAPAERGPWVLLAAARLGGTRLLDCLRVGAPAVNG